jgi:NAD(P)-dependent dehydrogenase (short-subunit alcohol dehydrogenase family)
MKIVLADIDGPRVEAATRELRELGAQAECVRTDVARAEEVERLADVAYARFGAVHLLVNNAGVACAKPVWETTPGDWEWVIGVNLYGVANGLRSFVPRMIAVGEEGHVVNTGSVAGLVSMPSLAAYNASKHAVVTVSEGLHHDLQLRGARIGVSVLCPGWVKTRIALSERNRTSGELTRVEALDPVAAKIGAAVQHAVAEGIPPARVATDVFAAVAEGRFYILTHANEKAGVKARMEDILNDRLPTLLRM